MAGNKLMTIVTGILAALFSPVILAVAAFVGAVLMFFLCPRVRAMTGGSCITCYSELCPALVMVITLAAFPLILILIGILWYRRAMR